MRRTYWFILFRRGIDGQTAIVQGGSLRRAVALVHEKIGSGWKLEIAGRLHGGKLGRGQILSRILQRKLKQELDKLHSG